MKLTNKAGLWHTCDIYGLNTIVNSIHDVAKIKPRKFPAVEIRCKFIGNFLSNQKQLLKC